MVEDDGGEPRFGMLETIREYALEQLAAHGETEVTRREHATSYLRLAQAAEPKLFGADQLIWLKRLEAEHDNLRAALRWFLDSVDAAALHLSGTLVRFWFMRGYWSEGRRWLTAAIEAGHAPETVRAKALTGAGLLAYYEGDTDRAIALCDEGLQLSRQLGDQAGIAAALNGLALAIQVGANYAAARAMYQESMDILRALQDTWGLAHTLNYLGLTHSRDDPPAARAFIAEGLALFRKVGDRWGIALSLNNLGTVTSMHGEFAEARPLVEEALVVFRTVEDKQGMSRTLWLLGYIARNEGDYALARRLYLEALAILYTLGDRVLISQCLDGLAAVATVQGQPAAAARLFAAATVLRDASGVRTPAHFLVQREQQLVHTRTLLGDDQFLAAWTEGQTMTPEQAAAQLSSELPELPSAVQRGRT